jgi:hypothetical protein
LFDVQRMEKNEKYFGVRGFIPLTVRRLAWLPIRIFYVLQEYSDQSKL